MADAQTIIELIFEGVDKTGAATDAVLKNTKGFATDLEKATQPVADFTESALKLEVALLGAGAAIVAFSVSLAGDFQSSLADLNKVLSDTDSLETYRDLAIELSETYGVASNDVLAAITNYKQAGFTAEEAGKLTKAGLDLVIAGSIDAADGANLLVASIKGFGAEAEDASIIVDLLNQVSNEYAVTTRQLLEGFSVLSPVADAAGLSLQETIGILTPGIEVFQSGSEVANALRTAFIRLTDDSKPVQEGLEALGVSQKDANGELRSARDIYFDVADALQDVDDNQQLYIASQLVGINRSSEFLAVTNGLDKTLRIAGEGFDFLGSAAEEVAIQLDTAENASNRAKVALENLFIGIGAPLLDEFSGVADALTAIFQEIAKSAEGETGIAELVEFVESQFAGLQATLEEVARNLPAALDQADFSGFEAGVAAVGEALGMVFGDIDLTTAEGLADVITGIGDAFNALSQFSAGVIESFEPLVGAFFDVGQGLGEIDEAAFKSSGQLAGFLTQINLLSGPAIAVAASLISLKAALDIAAPIKAATVALGSLAGGGLIGAIATLGGAGVAGAAGFAIGSLANEVTELATDKSISTWILDVAEEFGLFGDEAYKLVESLEESTPAFDAAGVAAQKVKGDMEDAAAGVATLDDEIGTIQELAPIFEKATPAIESASNAFVELGNAVEDLDLDVTLALIEAQTKITTAQIEADADKSVAAFESIGVSISETSENLRELYGLFADAESISDKFFLEEQIKIQNELQQEALELQKALTEEQIRASKALRDRLAGGEALITVNGDGLQPELEAFMWKILETIQVRVNEDGLDLLLGLG